MSTDVANPHRLNKTENSKKPDYNLSALMTVIIKSRNWQVTDHFTMCLTSSLLVLWRPIMLLRLRGVVVEEAQQIGEGWSVDRYLIPALQHYVVHHCRTVDVWADRTWHAITVRNLLQGCCTVHACTSRMLSRSGTGAYTGGG